MKRKRGAQRIVSTAMAAVLCMLGSGCAQSDVREARSVSPSSSSEPSASDYRFPISSAGDFTFSWTALPGIDLYSRAAAVTRGYVESCQLSKNLVRQTYPGWRWQLCWALARQFQFEVLRYGSRPD